MENIRNVAFIGSDVGKTISDILVNEDENGNQIGCHCQLVPDTMDILCEGCSEPYANTRYIIAKQLGHDVPKRRTLF